MAKIIIMGRYQTTRDHWFEYASNKKEFTTALDKIYSNVKLYGFVRKVIIEGNSIPKYVLNECDPSFIMDSIELVKGVK